MGRKSEFNQDIADKICEGLIQGLSLTTICKARSMPSDRTILRWLDHPDNSAFCRQYARAREAGADWLANEIIDIADNSTPENVNNARLQIDARKWYASKLKPKKYGDRITTEHTGNVSLTDLSEAELDRRLKELELEIERSTED